MKTESGELVAVVANQLIQAACGLSPWQRKFVFFCISQIARDDDEFREHRITASEFIEYIGDEGKKQGDAYRRLGACADSLLRAVLHIRINEGDRNRRKFQWLSRCDYADGSGAVVVQFHAELRPFLLELRSRFTQLRIAEMLALRSNYSIRFYQRIEMQRGLNRLSWVMTVDELREWLNLEATAYSSFPAFRAYVLARAQRELDAKSDWSFSFETVKTGRKITGVEFTIRPAKAPKNDPARARWKKAPPELRAKVIANAQRRPMWEGKTADEVQATPEFWSYLPDLLAAVEQGQGALPLT